ncbi:MAG: DinB family protein [Bacillota bacterium]
MFKRPGENEYSDYYKSYIALIPEGTNIIQALEKQLEEFTEFFSSIPEDKAGYRYAEGKWTIREVLGHLADSERIFTYRALRISRSDDTPLPGFEENDYVAQSNFNNQTMKDLLDHLRYIRMSTISLFKSMDETMAEKVGVANNHKISVRALAYITAGHAWHHIAIIKERYLKQ